MAKNTAKTTRKAPATRARRGSQTKRAAGRATKTKAKNASRKAGKARKSSSGGARAGSAADQDAGVKRKLGLRGAAPWAARHAAKHAAEARARNSVPPPPGSARATLRVPDGAEKIKARVGELHTLMTKIRALRKNLSRGFYELGIHLEHIRDDRLYEAKGYGSFENFLEREVDLGKTLSLKLTRIHTIFQKDAALEHGLDATLAALSALEGETLTAVNGDRRLPLKPPAGGGNGGD